jgi:hypothetical protein
VTKPFLKTSVGIARSLRYIARQQRSVQFKDILSWLKPNDGSIWPYRSLRLTFRSAREPRASSKTGKQPEPPLIRRSRLAVFHSSFMARFARHLAASSDNGADDFFEYVGSPMLVGPISRYRLRPPHPASPSPCLFWLTVVRLAPVLPDQNLRAAVRLAAVFAPGALQGLLSLDRLPRFNRQQLPKAVGVAMGITVFRIRIELIFRRCGNLITPSRSGRALRPNVGPRVRPADLRGKPTDFSLRNCVERS